MNQDSAHSEQNSPVAGTAETHQNQQNTQTDNTQEVKTSKSDSQPPKNSKIKLIIAVVVIALLGLIILVCGKAINLSLLNYKAELRLKQFMSVLRFRAVLKKFMCKRARKFPKVSPLFV